MTLWRKADPFLAALGSHAARQRALGQPRVRTAEQLRAQWLWQKYRVTPAWYDAKLEEQGHCCAICGKHQSECRRAFAVDHSHTTGAVRGLLCTRCNTGLGLVEKFLAKVLGYLASY
jgi:hypothetical protein